MFTCEYENDPVGRAKVNSAGEMKGNQRAKLGDDEKRSRVSVTTLFFLTDAMKPAIYKVSEDPAAFAKAPSSRTSLTDSAVSPSN